MDNLAEVPCLAVSALADGGVESLAFPGCCLFVFHFPVSGVIGVIGERGVSHAGAELYLSMPRSTKSSHSPHVSSGVYVRSQNQISLEGSSESHA